jgi:hypothetical protein
MMDGFRPPAYYGFLAGTAAAEEYASVVKEMVESAGYDAERHLKAARAVATPAQKKALREARRSSSGRGSRAPRYN